jgi:selenocysteine lyase/cysteine desulfurase
MLPSQRVLFDIPRDVCYLNAASWSPLPRAVQEAGRIGVGRKGQPWTLDPAFASQQHERARRAAAALVNAEPEDVALISSVAYGVATAGKLVRIPAGHRVLVLQDDHTSPVLEWQTRAQADGFSVETVRQPDDGDWTASVLAAIARPSAPPVALASISSIHWSDGCTLDVGRIASALRAQGAALLVDATHGAGVMPIDVRALCRLSRRPTAAVPSRRRVRPM